MSSREADRLRWRCRRGLLELDLLLEAFLRHGYEDLDPTQASVFEDLLALPDQQLLQYLLGLEKTTSQGQAHVIDLIRRTAQLPT